MRASCYYLAYLHCLLVLGCTTTKDPSGKHMFAFVHDGERFEIVSIVTPTGPGGNFLVRFDDGQILLRASDYDQDGLLDTLMVGDLTLDRANEIYQIGIEEAILRGRFAVYPRSTVYELTTDERIFAIRTYRPSSGRPYNKFIIYAPHSREEIVLIDTNADGVLDSVERGHQRLEASQASYERILALGLREGKIERIGNRLLVTN